MEDALIASTDRGRSLSDTERREIDAELAHLPSRPAAAIDALKIVQSHRGWVSDESLLAIADYLEMPAAELEGIATFYNLVFRKPVGEQVILLCDSVSCWIKGCEQLRSRIGERLGIEPGQTTADNRYTLLPITCLGACDRAPVMMVGDTLHGDVDIDNLDAIFSEPGEPT